MCACATLAGEPCQTRTARPASRRGSLSLARRIFLDARRPAPLPAPPFLARRAPTRRFGQKARCSDCCTPFGAGDDETTEPPGPPPYAHFGAGRAQASSQQQAAARAHRGRAHSLPEGYASTLRGQPSDDRLLSL